MIDINLNKPQDLHLGDWQLKVRPPLQGDGDQVVLLNHGWTGDERAMWIFANAMPKDAWLLAARAPFKSAHEDLGGYSWVDSRADAWSSYNEFGPARQSYLDMLDQLAARLKIDIGKYSLVGFSQGAAFNMSLALDVPEQVERMACLAGFAPEGSREQASVQPLQGKPVFIAHGSQDQIVPLSMALQAKEILELAGAQVEYCEGNVGHKLGANCLSALKNFFAQP